MSWRFPILREEAGHICDVNMLNENIRPFNDEISGFLNEHNFAVNAHTSNTNLEHGAVIRIVSVSQAVDPAMGQSNPPPTATPADGFKVPTSGEWETVSITDATYETDDTICHIITSFQVQPSLPGGASEKYGIQFAIAIDGIILNETITGSVDKEIDVAGEGYSDSTFADPMVVEAIEPVAAGQHRFALKARMVPNQAYNQFTNLDYYMILNREMIVLELW